MVATPKMCSEEMFTNMCLTLTELEMQHVGNAVYRTVVLLLSSVEIILLSSEYGKIGCEESCGKLCFISAARYPNSREACFYPPGLGG